MVYLLISVCLIGSLLFIAPVVTYAETEAEIASNEQIYKELTDSDELPGQNITLDGYINNLKTGYYEDGTTQKYEENTKHLSSIIPIDLFASANETYYWGKEYFFYICIYHSNTRLTSKVVLVDYDFEYNELKKSADVLIKTITKNFFYIENGGKPMLKPAAEKEVVDVDKAVLFNPVLFGIINNKHALNDYDAEYSKNNDKGIIFRQARMNFSGAYRESNFSWEPIEKLIFDKAFGAAMKFLHLDFISDVKDIIYAIADGIEGAEKEVEANNEAEITDYYTKDAQIADESIKY